MRPSAWRRLRGRARTLGELVRHFASAHRFFLLPLLLVLLLAALLLVVTGGLSYVTPFLYAIF